MNDAGKYRVKIQFQKHDGAVDEFGAPDNANCHWQRVWAVWAKVNPVSGREFYQAMEQSFEITHKIECRYRAGLTPDMRIALGPRIFRIVSIIDWEERHEGLLIMAKEVVQNEENVT